MVSKSPFDFRNAENAIRFCEAAIGLGHTISQVFFYQSGVQNASQLLLANTDEVNVREKWIELHQQFGIPLNVCVTAGARRGVLVSDDVTRLTDLSILSANLCSPFQHVGLSDYFQAIASDSINIQL